MGAVAIEEDDLFKAVVGQAFADIDIAFDKVLPIDVNGAGKVHDVGGVAVDKRRHDQHVVGDAFGRLFGHAARADDIDIHRQVGSVLFGRTDGHDDDFFGRDGLVDIGPSQFFITPGFSHGNLQ